MKTQPNAPINVVHDSPNGPWNGLTKREYFAAMAMQGLIANSGPNHEHAKVAIVMADDLIFELNK